MESTQEKAALRNLLKARRAQITPSQHRQKSEEVCAQLGVALSECEIHPSPPVAVYQALAVELDLTSFIKYLYTEGFTVAFPCIEKAYPDAAPTMQIRVVSNLDWRNSAAPFIANPTKTFDAHSLDRERFPVLEPSELKLLVCPLLGFDSQGMRLGYGGGFYDRYLASVSRETYVWGVAFAEQKLDSIPSEPHDQALPRIFYA